MIIFITTQIIINLLLTLTFILILSSNDISYYLKNFITKSSFKYDEYQMNISLMNIPCIVFNVLALVVFIIKVVSIYKLEDVT